MKFVHAANIRLGFLTEEDKKAESSRREEYRADLKKLIGACNSQKADALFITGNLFYGDVTREQIAAVDDMFMGLETARVFLLAGASDTESTAALLADYEWRSSVIYFNGDNIRKVFLAKLNTEITGMGYRKEMFERLTRTQLQPGKRGAVQILLLPFAGTDPEKEDPDFLPNGFHYIGTGSSRKTMGEDGRRIYAPGLFEPEGFSAQTRHGFITGSLETENREIPELRVNFQASASREYLTFRINADTNVTYEEVENKVQGAIRTYGTQNYYKIEIRGEASPSLYLNKDQLLETEGVLEVADYCRADESLNNMKLAHENDAVGKFMAVLTEKPDTPVRKLALKYGTDALRAVEHTGEAL